jgi:hypothetical protein
MTTHAPTPTAAGDLVPPEEAFWVRYSPHHEFPLSAVTSFALHLLTFGLVVLIAFKIASFFSKPVHEVPVLAVRLGGGGTNPDEPPGRGPGNSGIPAELGETHRDAEQADNGPVERPDLKVKPTPMVPEFKDTDATKKPTLAVPDRKALETIGSLAKAAGSKVGNVPANRPGKPGRGSGDKPGHGDGSNGPGPGSGPGGTIVTDTTRRNLRWTMHFNVFDTADYLRQIQGLGAVLAIPDPGSAGELKLLFVKDLSRRPVELGKVDLGPQQRIYWFDRDPQSVANMMAMLGLPHRPSYFVAVMPAEMEGTLYELEKAHAQGHHEKEIKETHFRVRQEGGRYFPVFESITFKKPGDPVDP